MSIHAQLASNVTRLADAPVSDPSASDIQALAPQLTTAEARELLHSAKTDRRTYFAGPPLQVRGALQMYVLDGRTTGIQQPPRKLTLAYAYATRQRASFAARPVTEQVPVRFHARTYDGLACGGMAERINDWSEINCHKQLVWDESVSVLHGYLMRMPDATSDGRKAYATADFAAWLSRPFNGIIDDPREPRCEVLNDAILTLSYSPVIQQELLAFHSVNTCWYCALCGGGIGDNGTSKPTCSFCGMAYTGACIGETGRLWCSALPYRAHEAMTKQYDLFQSPPLEARKHEHAKWAISNYCPPSAVAGSHGRQQRVIDLKRSSHATD